MGFSGQEYWNGLLLPTPDLPDPRIEPVSPVLAGRFFTTEPPGKSVYLVFSLSFLCLTSFYEVKLGTS